MSTWTITTITTMKYTWYASAFIVFEFLDIPQMQIWILGALMVFDFITGVWKQFRLNRRLITSHEAWLWLMKKIWSFILIFSLALVIKWMELEADWYVKWAISILIVAEFYSIIQNIYIMRTWKVVAEFDAISIFLKLLWEFVRKRIEKFLSNKIK